MTYCYLFQKQNAFYYHLKYVRLIHDGPCEFSLNFLLIDLSPEIDTPFIRIQIKLAILIIRI